MRSGAALGLLGEDIAARFLSGRGLKIVARNIRVRGGEIDLLAFDGKQRVVVEVRTRIGAEDALDSIDAAKRDRVGRLKARFGGDRVDLVGILARPGFVDIHWVPDAV